MHKGHFSESFLVCALTILIASFNPTSGDTIVYDYIYLVYDSPPTLYDLAGQAIDIIQVGQQGLVEVSVRNPDDPAMERTFVIIVEIRDGFGVTNYLAYQSNTIAGNGSYKMSVSWRPEIVCESPNCNNYVLRSFAISNLTNPEVLSIVEERSGILVVESENRAPITETYTLATGGNEYDIIYTTDFGVIRSIAFDPELGLLTMSVHSVYRDTMLDIQIPRALAIEVFACEGSTPDNQPVQLFIDGTMAGLVEIGGGEYTTLNVPLQAGSEEVEIFGGDCLL